jgi:hypothetical protein
MVPTLPPYMLTNPLQESNTHDDDENCAKWILIEGKLRNKDGPYQSTDQ